MQFTDTHCHIHDPQYGYDPVQILSEAKDAGVKRLICIGTSALDSRSAMSFAQNHPGVWAGIAQHPHEAARFGKEQQDLLTSLAKEKKVVGIGECGLDYYYSHSPKKDQQTALRWHLQLASDQGLPLMFHIRDAFDDFWPIFDEFPGLRGVIHCFTAGPDVLEQAIARGLYVAFNGIMTFSKDKQQLEALRQAPLESMMLETDAPYLTPKPFRGKINSPKRVVDIARFVSEFKQEPLEKISQKTESNVTKLFGM